VSHEEDKNAARRMVRIDRAKLLENGFHGQRLKKMNPKNEENKNNKLQ